MTPYAWMSPGGSISTYKASEDDVPLFTKSSVQLEQERIIAILQAKHEESKHRHNYYACLIREIFGETR